MTTPSPIRLPTYQTSLIGRAADVAAISAQLRQPATRMLTLVGPSGAGKTRLALEAATALVPHFADGIVFIALAPVQDTRFALSTIAQALGIKEQANQPLLETLGRELKERRMLLILDNIEQVRSVGPELSALLSATAHLSLLVTSQLALEVELETVYALPPLSVPADTAVVQPAALMQYPGIALFVERLQAVQPDFRLSERNASPVVRICQLLHGYPLAIELVAAHSAALAPKDLLLLLRNHLGVQPYQRETAGSSRTAILGPVLDWCANRLPALAQPIFLQLGVFLGGWRADAAQAVMAPTSNPAAIAAALEVLVQKHLVLVETLPGQEPRFVVLDAVREYSATRLNQQQQAAETQERHAGFYQRLAAEAEEHLLGSQQAAWGHRLDAEIHNIRLALQWSLDHGRPAETLASAGALTPFWSLRSLYAEGREWLTTALEATADQASAAHAKGWHGLGQLAYRQGDYGLARAGYDRGLSLYAALDNDHGQARTLSSLGGLLLAQGKYDESRTTNQQSLALMRKVEDRQGTSTVLNNLAFVSRNQGRYAEAQQYIEESLALATAAGDELGAGRAVLNLGVLQGQSGDPAAAQASFTEALRRFQALGDERNIGFCIANLGVIATEQGDYATARQHYETVLERYRAVDDLRGQAMMAEAIGYVSLVQDDWAQAEQWLADSQRILADMGEVNHLMVVYGHQCRLALARNDLPAAWTAMQVIARHALSRTARPMLVEAAEFAALILGADAANPLPAQLWQAARAARDAWTIQPLVSLSAWYARHGMGFESDNAPPADPGAELTRLLQAALDQAPPAGQ